VDDFERLQHDEQSVLAKAVVAAVRRVGVPAGGASDRAARMIAAWDGTVSRDSAAAALYEAWLPRLAGAVAENLAHGPGAPFGAGGAERVSNDRLFALLLQTGLSPSPSWLDAWVDGTPRPHGASLFTALDATLRERVREAVSASLAGPTLAAAWQEMTERLGPDPALWAWGRMHRASFEHALAGSPALASVLNTADVPRGGDATTPNATGTGGRQTAGASYREVIDLAHWDRSMTINVPGLSGQPGSPHYADLLPLWAEGGYHPMPFTRAAVEQCAADRLWLVPPHSGPR
jgi:penicillin amidase